MLKRNEIFPRMCKEKNYFNKDLDPADKLRQIYSKNIPIEEEIHSTEHK